MEIFKLLNVLVAWSGFASLGLASQQQPGISIVAVVGIGNRSVTYTPDTHVILPDITSTISLRCQASFPVMWTIESLESNGVNGTTSQRIVGSFHDPTTYEFSMTVKLNLERNWEVQEEQKLLCVAVATDGPSSAVSLRRDASLGAFILSSGSAPASISRQMSTYSNPNMTLSIADVSAFVWGNQETVTCRVGPGAWPASTFLNLKIGSGICAQPLMCLTPNYKVETNTGGMDGSGWARNFNHRRIDASYLYPTDTLPNPTLYTCQATESSERAQLLYGHSNSLAWLQFQIESEMRVEWNKLIAGADNANKRVIYAGDALQLRCQGSPFIYAGGALLHFEFKNGTETFLQNETAGNPQNFELSVPVTDTNLTRISCHFPPWNSTDWVTVSLAMDVRVPSPPVSIASGATTTHQNVSFLSQQSSVLDCDFMGVPQPKFIWDGTSGVYSVFWDWGLRNGTVTVSKEYLKSGGQGPIPAAQFVCTAYNVAGKATKFFNVQATRSVAPAMDNSVRHAVVMCTGDRGRSLNCSVSQALPAPVFRWEVNGLNITDIDNGNYEQRNHGAMESGLVFKKVGLDDDAEFACIATNFLGSLRKEFSVRIRERSPGATAAPTATGWVVAGWFVTITVILLLLSVAFMAYRLVKQRKKIRTLETMHYSKREEGEEAVLMQ